MDPLALQERILKTVELGESQFREFKSAYEGPPDNKVSRERVSVAKDIAEALVGFANADGGELLVGVEDDRSITGHAFSKETVAKLLKAPITGVHIDTPLSSPIALELEIAQKKILYFSIEKGTKTIHQTADGRCLQRRDRETKPVSTHSLQFERQEQLSREYDRQYVDHATVLDLNIELVKSVSSATSHMSPEKCLQYLGLADYGLGSLRLKRAALLLFGAEINRWHPRCQVRVVRIRGTELRTGREMNIAFDEIATGNILQLITDSWEKLRPHLVETKLSSDALFKQHVMYPEDACREALVNAITHRDYSLEGRNIEILIFDDRMEVHSPGALLSTVSINALKKASGIHESRNALVARVLREIGYVREMGEGMRRIFRLFNDADLIAPDLKAEAGSFAIILHYKSVFSSEDQHWLAGYKRLHLSREEMLVALLGKNGKLISPRQIYDLLGLVDWDVYRELVERMYMKGLLWSTLTQTQKLNHRKKHDVQSNRDVQRLAIRTPEEIERSIAELFGTVAVSEQTSTIDNAWIRTLRNNLPKENIYRESGHQVNLLKLIGLVDEGGSPTDLMKALWTSAPKPIEKKSKILSLIEEDFSHKRRPRTLSPPAAQSKSEPLEIHVGNLSYEATEREVFHTLQQAGQVIDVQIPLDHTTNRSRGFARVKMATHEGASKALSELNGKPLKGRPMYLNWAR